MKKENSLLNTLSSDNNNASSKMGTLQKQGTTTGELNRQSTSKSGTFTMPTLNTMSSTRVKQRIPDAVLEDLRCMWAFLVHEWGDEDSSDNSRPSSKEGPSPPTSPKGEAAKQSRISLSPVMIDRICADGEEDAIHSEGKVRVSRLLDLGISEVSHMDPDDYIESIEQFVSLMCPKDYRPPSAVPGLGRLGMGKSTSHPDLGKGEGIDSHSEEFRRAVILRLRAAIRGQWDDINAIHVPGHVKLEPHAKRTDPDWTPRSGQLSLASVEPAIASPGNFFFNF